MTMADFDIARSRPLRLGIELSATQPWIELTALRGGADGPLDTPMRVQAADLRDAYQKVATIRAESAYEVPTLLDVEVMIAQDSRSARTSLAILDSALRTVRRPASLLYVGTPSGLAGLIADIHTLGIADGVILRPLVVPGVLSHILDEVLPALCRAGLQPCDDAVKFVRRVAAGRQLRPA
jgi:alkanesulfonate monooxygenase SsuD/methylene tetrahydromethanopterin reductase-like flavin-dependent oxidoreductase (luciferase family)